MTHAPRAKKAKAMQIAKEALEFYSLLRRDLYKQGSMTETLVKMDGGDKAREALKKINEILKEEKK